MPSVFIKLHLIVFGLYYLYEWSGEICVVHIPINKILFSYIGPED